MFARYQPRPLTFLGVEDAAGTRLKVYGIQGGEEPFERGRFAGGWRLACETLPQPATNELRPGVGFAVLHQTQGEDYLILAWWDRENELPTRVFLGTGQGWRAAQGAESFCVWDLRVMWWEREAYVGTVMAGRAGGLDAYLSVTAEGWA